MIDQSGRFVHLGSWVPILDWKGCYLQCFVGYTVIGITLTP